ncbi:G2/mitotic-specific cyclin-B-like [Saccostrea echinata]|uniref:G2/mitotic-specific cyclin-B-like n=1 Tax=Saccostrea echinata TaxID=191078 RepID=UPI002A84071A|nr:G2/mitotic-specific cyclin-B-like [Saccostrea echinata]
MAASVAVSQTQQQRNVGGKQRMLSHLESNKENLPFEMQSTKKENHLERMDVSPLNRGEVKGKHLSQSDKVKEKVALRDRINAQQYSKGGNQKVKATSDSLWAKKGGLLKKGKSLQKAVFSVNNPEPLAVMDDDFLPMDIDFVDPLEKIREVQVKIPKEIQEIQNKLEGPFNNPDYAEDIYEYLQFLERRFIYPDNFLNNSGEVTPQMRSILTDWFIQVQVHQELSQQTLHLTVELVDRFLTFRRIPLNTFQLVGITCLLIAAKYNERFAPEVQTLCYLTDNTYDKEQVLRMERQILKTIDFDLNIVDVTVFMDKLLLIESDLPKEMRQMTKYILDLTLVSDEFVYSVPSMMASAAVCLARKILVPVEPSWTLGLSYFSRYAEKDLIPCMKKMLSLLIKAPDCKFQGAQVKYSSESCCRISQHPNLKNHPEDILQELTEKEEN